ncbi:MAG: hypothetical protein A2W99_13640 [Bacteroidetes bacterium GWF2_33_16]|nr:MAG: hypothetical protein A2X00_08295 [Bacteroidetes bacterium GWE2_32_14]OFY06718.1 MAG: hypothetical protein A2W99_13640 [Bacteroidetes bacterium GWF2_33_16]
MHYHYFSSINDQDYLGRILLFAKHNLILYIPDIVTLLFLILPPYSWLETKIIIGLALLLSIRDILLLKYAVFHLGKFIIDGDSVSIAILRKSELHKQYTANISEIDLIIKGKLWFKKVLVLENQKLIHCQYAIGNWSPRKLIELHEHFYHIKRELGFWKMFKGPIVN